MEVKMTKWKEEVFIKFKDKPCQDTFGDWGPRPDLLGKIKKVKRTGSHTWQLVESINGWFGNFPVQWVEKVYTKEEYPQLFI
jgi:hypothetical protein